MHFLEKKLTGLQAFYTNLGQKSSISWMNFCVAANCILRGANFREKLPKTRKLVPAKISFLKIVEIPLQSDHTIATSLIELAFQNHGQTLISRLLLIRLRTLEITHLYFSSVDSLTDHGNFSTSLFVYFFLFQT